MAGGFANGRSAFRGWRRNRPFWGGFLMILSGVFLFLSGNLDLGNIQIHLGVTGFLSYIIPAFMIIVGVLAWATPPQRMLYGIPGIIAALYSIVSVNLGGFLIGMLLGIIGGGLTVAWVPIKHTDNPVPVKFGDAPEPTDSSAPDSPSSEFPDGVDREPVAPGGEPISEAPGGSADQESGSEGKQGARFREPRHARVDRNAGELTNPSLMDSRPVSRNIRPLLAGVAALALAGSIAVVTLQSPGSAAAAATDCTTPSMTQLMQSAKAKAPASKSQKAKTPGNNVPSTKTKSTDAPTAKVTRSTKTLSTKTLSTKTRSTTTTGTSPGATQHGATSTTTTDATPKTSTASDGSKTSGAGSTGDSGPIGSLLGALGGLLSGAKPSPPSSSSTPSEPAPAPSATTPTSVPTTPGPSKAPAPSKAPPAPSKTPTAPATSKPATSKPPTHRPPATKPAPGHPSASPSSTSECAVVSKKLTAAGGQVDVQETPAVMKTDTLTMSGLSYDGTVDLPTNSGSITVMQFSMDSSTSTPFEMDVTTGGNVMKLKSSKLTVSGNVKFYSTELKGNLLGVVPVDFTPANPPPLTIPDLFFTDVTIGLENVVCNQLTAPSLTIS